MAVDQFNSFGGYSTGIPPVPVVDANGNVISNFNNLNGNVSANKIYANTYYYANGQVFNATPGGSNTQLQFNNNGEFAGIPNVTFNGSNLSLGNVANLKILGGTNGYVLQTDGAGNLSWVAGGGGGNGTPGGSNTQVQFNDDTTFAGNAAFTFDKNTGILAIPIVSANTVSGNAIQTTGNITAGNIRANTLANIAGNLRVTGNVNFTGAANVTLGTVANLKISGGTNGYVLTTDGLGNLDWAAGGGGGNGTPGGSNTQIQYNNNGAFGGDPNFIFNQTTDTVTVGGNLIANSFQIGSGVYAFCTSEVYFASTASSTPNQLLYSVPVEDISGVDFHVIATDSVAGSRQSAKISSLYYGGNIQFNEYAGLQVNGGVGNFEVDYDAGNIVNPASLQLKVSPNSAHVTIYRILITSYSD